MLMEQKNKSKKEKVICNFICKSCGSLLGQEAIHLSDEHWKAFFNELHEKNPGVRFRLMRSVHAICTNCGYEYTYHDKDCSLIPYQSEGNPRRVNGD
jgi:RNase P subunit RPR2